jgi:hypothetical protein
MYSTSLSRLRESRHTRAATYRRFRYVQRWLWERVMLMHECLVCGGHNRTVNNMSGRRARARA